MRGPGVHWPAGKGAGRVLRPLRREAARRAGGGVPSCARGRLPAAGPASSGLGSRRHARAPQARVPSAAVGGDPGKTWCSPRNPLIHCELGFHRGLTLKPASLLLHCLPPRVSYFSHLLHVDLNIWVLGKEVDCFRTPPYSGPGVCVRARAGPRERYSGVVRCVRARGPGFEVGRAHPTGRVDGRARARLGQGKQRRIYPPKVITVHPGK